MDKLSYSLGVIIGSQLKGMGAEEITAQDFAQAVEDVIKENTLAVAPAEAQRIVQQFAQETEARQKAQREAMGKELREAGEQFLAENAKKPGIKVTASGLQYEVLKEGTLKKPKATDSVKCHYEGRLIDGTVFDSSYQRGTPATFPLNGVISGWTEGLQLMGEGAKFRFYLPYQLAYGEHGAGASIPPYAALIFDVELISVV